MTASLQMDDASRVTRRERIRGDAVVTGIDQVLVETLSDHRWLLRVLLIPDDARSNKNSHVRPENLRVAHLDGSKAVEISIAWDDKPPVPSADADRELQLTVELKPAHRPGVPDVTEFLLSIDTARIDSKAEIDPIFATSLFSLDGGQLAAPARPPVSARDIPEIDYQTRDYAGFRQLMMDRMATLVPDWNQRHPEDAMTMLLELLAHSADQLSYYQDAVATEAYPSTARQRISLRRHAMLLGHQIDEGCNARAWVAFHVRGSKPVELPAGTKLLSKVGKAPTRLSKDSPELRHAHRSQATVFETAHAATLEATRNEIQIYDWGAREFHLPVGTTTATLRGDKLNLEPGAVVIFEERKCPEGGKLQDADLEHRQAVRLTRVADEKDPLNPEVALCRVEWDQEDALTFAVHVSVRAGLQTVKDAAVVLGNVILADHGETLEEVLRLDQQNSQQTHPRVALSETSLTFCQPYDHSAALRLSAANCLKQKSSALQPAIELKKLGLTWSPFVSLLDQSAFTAGFVVEMDNQRRAHLRFGDGNYGLRPRSASVFQAKYRVGNGRIGNLGRESIRHVVTDSPIDVVRNPLPASGGVDPQDGQQIRAAARAGISDRVSCVTPSEFVTRVMEHPEVQEAEAESRWTGAWWGIRLYVYRCEGKPVDVSFRQQLLDWLTPFRVAGVEVSICPPTFVPLDIQLTAELAASAPKERIARHLDDLFSKRLMHDGEPGLMHANRLSFGQTLYASQLVSLAMEVPGVRCAHLDRLRRWTTYSAEMDSPPEFLRLGPHEMARVDNDPALPQQGQAIVKIHS